MKYYNMKFNPDELGSVPQDKGLIGNYYVDAPNALRHFKLDDQMNELWVPEGIMLQHRAKITDVLCLNLAIYPYLTFSEKFLAVISNLRLPKHQVFPLNVVKKEKSIPYNIFISKVYFAEYIDFEQSSFYFYYHETEIKEFVDIKTTEEFWACYNKSSELKYLKASKIELKKDSIVHDIFRLPRALSNPLYVVSEVFVEAVTKAKLTGVHFVPFGEFYKTALPILT